MVIGFLRIRIIIKTNCLLIVTYRFLMLLLADINLSQSGIGISQIIYIIFFVFFKIFDGVKYQRNGLVVLIHSDIQCCFRQHIGVHLIIRFYRLKQGYTFIVIHQSFFAFFCKRIFRSYSRIIAGQPECVLLFQFWSIAFFIIFQSNFSQHIIQYIIILVLFHIMIIHSLTNSSQFCRIMKLRITYQGFYRIDDPVL